MEILQKEFVIGQLPMICASHEAQIRKYKKLIGKSGRIWVVAIQPNSADNIYVEGGKNSDGFGGRELSFLCLNGELIKLKGPWCSNSDALFNDTGYDIRDKHYSRLIVSLGRSGPWNRVVLTDVIYIDEEPILSTFMAYKTIVLNIANKLDKPVYYYHKTTGGSISGQMKPGDK